MLARLGVAGSGRDYVADIDAALDAIAAELEVHVDLDALLAISQFAADTAAHELRFPAQRIAMIGAGVEGQFMPATADPWPRLREVLHADGRAVGVSGTRWRARCSRRAAPRGPATGRRAAAWRRLRPRGWAG